MIIGITGGAGFIGSWLVRYALHLGNKVVVFSDENTNLYRLPSHNNLSIEFTNSTGNLKVTKHFEMDALVLGDWVGVGPKQRSSEYQFSNLERINTFLDSIKFANTKKIIGLGSQAEYGPRSSSSTEKDLLNPVSNYAKAKVAFWNELQEYCAREEIESSWIRIFSVYGEMMNLSGILPKLLTSKLRNEEFGLLAPSQAWSFLYASDAARGIMRVIEKGKNGNSYNLSSEQPLKLEDVAELIGASWTDQSAAIKENYDEVGVLVSGTTEKLKTLGWEEKVTLEQGLLNLSSWILGKNVSDPFLNQVLKNKNEPFT